MWEDPVLEELHRIREEHAKAFGYDFKAIFADWKKRQATSGRKLVSRLVDTPADKSGDSCFTDS